MGRQPQELGLRLLETRELIRLLAQPVGFELLPLPYLELFLRLLGHHQHVADTPAAQNGVNIDVPDSVGGGPLPALRREVALRFAADAHQAEELEYRIVLGPVEDVTDRLPVGRHSLEGQQSNERTVAVAELEVLGGYLEHRHAARQSLQDTRQQFERGTQLRTVGTGALRWGRADVNHCPVYILHLQF